MEKKWQRIFLNKWFVVIIIFIAALGLIMFKINHFRIPLNAVRISQAELSGKSLSFDFIMRDSGYSISSCRVYAEDDRLYIRLYGAVLNCFQIKATDGHVKLPIKEETDNIRSVWISDGKQSEMIWEKR